MTFDGDLSRMSGLADRLADLANVPSRAARAVAFDLEGFVRGEFAEGVDPYGDPWTELAGATLDKGRHPPPLTDTGELLASLEVRPMRGAGVSIVVGADGDPAAPHQTGWNGPRGDGPARPILPARGELPEAWADAIEDRVSREARRAIGRSA